MAGTTDDHQGPYKGEVLSDAVASEITKYSSTPYKRRHGSVGCDCHCLTAQNTWVRLVQKYSLHGEPPQTDRIPQEGKTIWDMFHFSPQETLQSEVF